MAPYSLFLASASLLALANASLPPVHIEGNKFFFENGTQFYIKGVAYQQDVGSGGSGSNSSTFVDPLSDSDTCSRDIPYLQKLGTNVIRTYAIDPTANHDDCMSQLDAAGIYVISDLSSPDESIDRSDPAWNTPLYSRYTSVVDALANYTNTLGFFAGNEVTNNLTNTDASAYVKAAVRDMKAYIKAKGYRTIGVGYAADDDASVRGQMADYFNCGDQDSAIDFWGYNIYEWCGNATYTTSGYDQRTAEFANYSIPAFFAEYGCDQIEGGAAARPFTEVQALFGSEMNDVFSGGIVFEYFEQTNDYGLVSIVNDEVSTLADFNALATQIASVTVTGVASSTFTPTNTATRACPTIGSDWASSTDLPPVPNAELCSCMISSLSCVASSDLSDEDIGTLFGEVCGYNDGKPCAGIDHNSTTGVYGSYSMCNSTEQLSWAFNAYYLEQGSSSDACDFGGSAKVVSSTKPSGTCSTLLGEAASGTGTVTSSPTGTGSSSSASSTTHKGSAGRVQIPTALTYGSWILGAYALTAFSVGVGMVVL